MSAVFSVGVILNGYFEFIKPTIAPFLGCATLVITIISIAFRTIQDGFLFNRKFALWRMNPAEKYYSA